MRNSETRDMVNKILCQVFEQTIFPKGKSQKYFLNMSRSFLVFQTLVEVTGNFIHRLFGDIYVMVTDPIPSNAYSKFSSA